MDAGDNDAYDTGYLRLGLRRHGEYIRPLFSMPPGPK
jgi:hypothetical protein